MSAALVGAHEHLEEALTALEQAEIEVPAYCVEALRFLRAEVEVIRRRIENVRKAIGA